MLQFLIFLLLLSGELPVCFCIYCCYGISLVTVTYLSVLIDSVWLLNTIWRLVVGWYTTWLTVRLLGYYTLSEYFRGGCLQGSCILLVYN